MTATEQDWPKPQAAEHEEVLLVDVGGYEGPLDLLLDLARRHKVDLSAVSVLALAEQYLKFIEGPRHSRIEVAADYLVMAAWLAYLKSRLMVPDAQSDDEPSGEALAAMLQFRLARLEAMRVAARRLTSRLRLGVEVFARGMPEEVSVARRPIWEAGYYDLLKAYSGVRERGIALDYTPRVRSVWSLQDARELLERLIGESVEWTAIDAYLVQYLTIPEDRSSVRASTFASSLELVRQGKIDMRQAETFGPLFVRRRRDPST
ncbi:segregation/condensation protein A [Devosia sp. PTR5]|uniref:Segregation and condensation protein A n=1 Tax=Devosia oryzisoli TaxID=2774138 RepID=A0A927FTI3_9HYPH|nr:ScpA family protein [Devosia oryzisoli]MBD8064874.1 segregation/condensation protein A [Devosia oryzisoli]